ncbi:MAG: DNA-directed DNA polymerase II small subunit [Candidatus Micrarchaeia archaeon]
MSEAELDRLHKAGVRLTPEASDYVRSHPGDSDIALPLSMLGKFVISLEDVMSVVSNEKIPSPPAEVRRQADFSPMAAQIEPRMRFFEDTDVSGKSRCTGSVEDFLNYFRQRLERFKTLFKQRPSSYPSSDLSMLKENDGHNVRIIALVNEKSLTKNGHIRIVLEDEWGTLPAIFTKRNMQAFEKANGVLVDEAIAVEGKISGDVMFASNMEWLDLPYSREQKRTERDIGILYLSDLHFGSRFFMDKSFAKMLSWLKGREGNSELAGKIKYVMVGGDIVDGIGVYPGQEKELVILDIYKQYEQFDQFVESLPDYIEIVAAPGNHDAVRRADPQPAISKEFIKSRARLVGSPTWIEIEGLKHLMYHGTSLDSIIASVPNMSNGYESPEHPMMETLKRRHLSSSYGETGNTMVPEKKDYLIIEDEPDVLHMGHVHKNAVSKYRGTVVINSGTFQARTDFQVRMGHVPSPAIATVYEPFKLKVSHVDFSGHQK